jgi:homoserine dehydrogenase
MAKAPAPQSIVRIGVLGCGNVGAAFVQLVERQADIIEARTGVRLQVANVAVRNISRDREVALPDGVLTRDAHAVVADPSIDLIVEVIGGIEPARELIATAIANGKPVVTANKELLANVGHELWAQSDAAGVDLLFEAAVAGGIPLIRALRESLRGEPITRVMGIVNGTTNFILTKMTEEGADYSAALSEAQRLGFASVTQQQMLRALMPEQRPRLLRALLLVHALLLAMCITKVLAASLLQILPSQSASAT